MAQSDKIGDHVCVQILLLGCGGVMIPTLLQVMSMEEPFVSVTRGQGRTGGKNRCVHQQSQVSHCRERDRHLRLT